MRISLSRSKGVVLCALVALAIGGCSTPARFSDGDLIALDKLKPPAQGENSQASGPRDTSAEAARSTPSHDEVLAILAQPHWIRAVESDDVGEPVNRWTYPALEQRLDTDGARPHELLAELENPEPVVAANAAIALLRMGELEVAAPLAEAVRNTKLDLRLRCAAAEALGSADNALLRLQQLIDEESDRRPGLYSVPVHAELVRALGRQVRPDESPRLASALMAWADEVKIAALEAWQNSVGVAFPESGLALGNHRDPTIRAMLLPALAKNPSRETFDQLTLGLRDPDLSVRVAAISAMGTLGDPRAITTLEPIAANGLVGERIAALKALVELGRAEAAFAALDDESWRVRLALAEVLPDLPGEPDSDLATRLLDDLSAEVQYQAVVAIQNWPPRVAEPLLLRTLERGTYRSQKLAAESLVRTWPEGQDLLDPFPFGRPPQVREKALAEIRKAYANRQVADERSQAPQPTPVSPGQLAPIVEALRTIQTTTDETPEYAEAVATLRCTGPELATLLEYLVEHQGVVIPDVAFEVLAAQAPEFALVEQLREEDVQARRNAAQKLAENPARRRFSSLLIHRLADLAVTETDVSVWRDVLTTIADRNDDQVLRLVYAASGHDCSSVRQAACEHLRKHPDPQHVAVLTAALNDTSVAVACAAADAIGLCGGNVDPAPILQLLTSRSEPLRIAAATALVRLGSPEGAAALQRLAYSQDDETRLRVARVMGELGLSEFAPTLIRMLDDRHGIRLAALNGLPNVAECKEAANLHLHETERIAAWQRWAKQQELR